MKYLQGGELFQVTLKHNNLSSILSNCFGVVLVLFFRVYYVCTVG